MEGLLACSLEFEAPDKVAYLLRKRRRGISPGDESEEREPTVMFVLVCTWLQSERVTLRAGAPVEPLLSRG